MLILAFILSTICQAGLQTKHGSHITVNHSSVNGVIVEKDGHSLVIYGDPEDRIECADMVLFTHCRRDIVWAGRKLIENKALSVAPKAEMDCFTKAETFWSELITKRFHDYAQQTTKLPTESIKIDRGVSGGDTIQWRGVTIVVLDTPGYTRGAVSYLLDMDRRRYAFVGDLIYGQGKLFDLYSLQDAVKEANIGGYHGYAGRLGDLIESLRKVLAQKPDVLIPARGPVIENPKEAIELLIERVQAAYANYLSINAGHWYFKDNYDILAKRVLGAAGRVDWMPYAKTIESAPPDWIVPIDNSRLITSKDGAAFLVDSGSQSIIDKVMELKESGKFSSLDGLFITHYHDDHTDKVNELLKQFHCPVYVSPVMKDVLENPQAYRLPAMTSNAIKGLTVVPDGHKMRWKEFTLTFYDYPGQTIYHDALLVEKDEAESIFFMGDSFTPSGIDDYCLLNRNLMHEGMGYLYCLNFLKGLPPGCLLINEHVLEPFAYDENQIAHMIDTLAKRKQTLKELFPWDEPNYGVDERWARIYPYGQTVKPGETVEIAVKIFNHSDKPTFYTVTPHIPKGLKLQPATLSLNIAPRQENEASFKITTQSQTSPSVYIITSDIQFNDWDLRHWCEGIVKVGP